MKKLMMKSAMVVGRLWLSLFSQMASVLFNLYLVGEMKIIRGIRRSLDSNAVHLRGMTG